MRKEVKETLTAIKRPLQYASRNSFANLTKIKDLGRLVTTLSDRIFHLLDGNERKLAERLKLCFDGFDSLGDGEKRERITLSLDILEKIMLGETAAEDLPADNPSGEARPTLSHGPVTPHTTTADFSAARKALDTPIQFVKGVGPKLAALLGKRGVSTVEDALYLFPHRYDDRRNLRKIAQLKVGEVQLAVGDVLAAGEAPLARGGRKIFEAVIGDGSGTLALKWFNYNRRYMKSLFREGRRFLVSGEVKIFGGMKEIIHPETERLEKGEDELEGFRRILPVYPLTEGLSQKTVRKIMERIVVGFADSVVDGIPPEIRKRRTLIPLAEALRKVHFPPPDTDIALLAEKRSDGHRRLVYDEFFFLEMGIAMRRRGLDVEKGVLIRWDGKMKARLLERLPFRLTCAQKRVLREIERDLSSASPMHRLLQGDVGCGKTVVALVAALDAVEGGFQVAVMAPTEILAEQHYINFRRLAEGLGIRIELIKGSLRESEKKVIVQKVRKGDVDIVIGTHAIIQDGVSFSNLGLGIIDEQHRFGVVQRAKLKSMGPGDLSPNILVMTATPIPRSLAMTVYGDLELSVIDELPPGRRKVETRVFHERERNRVYNLIRRELQRGGQAYIVYPLIEESEKMELLDATRMAEELKGVFGEFTVGLVHGRMKVEEKEEVMKAFKRGKIGLLVSTTVIEVGIDVPNATIMVVEHAERFGLSQLHQLRGRVGRGSKNSMCILLAQYRKSGDAIERLKVMEKCSSGFDISEADLRLRGPGDFLGTRQSGMPDFRIGNILKDERILKEARDDAFEIVERDPTLSLRQHRLMKDVLKERWKGRLELAGVG